MINFLINWQDVNNGVLAALRMLLLKLCEPIYSLIVFCFDIFEDFGELRLFEGSDTISMIYNRIGLILGLFMVFRITFTAIEYLVDPDKILDSKQGIGNIIKKVLIVVILLGSTRYIFNFAFDLQSRLIESDVVGNLILGPSYIEENKYSAGTNLAWFTFTQFYTLNDRAKDDNNYENCRIMLESGNGIEANSGGSIYNDFHDNHKFNNAEYCLNLKTSDKYSIDSNVKEKQELNIIDFNGFICLAVGAILLWIIMTYTVQVAVRVFQLAYLELIAPIPIMMYLMPNGDEKLKKWAQQCLTTFLDFFIRLAIMDFIILVSNALVELEDTDSMLVTFNKLSSWGSGYVKIILIIALFAFVKKVPELLKELFPSTGGAASFGFGIKSPKTVWDAWKSTPILGAGAKAIGWGHNQIKKPIQANKEKRAEIKKVRKQAKTDARDYAMKDKVGKNLYDRYGNALPSSAFSSKKYQESYEAVAAAKAETKETERALENAQAEFSAAYNSTGADREERIAAARANYDNAKKQDRAAQTRLEMAKNNHEHMKKIYDKDAKIEDAYKHYADLHPALEQPTSLSAAPTTSSRQTIDLPTAAQIVNDSNASYDEQIRAAEELDAAAKERVKKENRLNEAAQTINNPNASAAEQERAAKILDAAARERNNNNNNK